MGAGPDRECKSQRQREKETEKERHRYREKKATGRGLPGGPHEHTPRTV